MASAEQFGGPERPQQDPTAATGEKFLRHVSASLDAFGSKRSVFGKKQAPSTASLNAHRMVTLHLTGRRITPPEQVTAHGQTEREIAQAFQEAIENPEKREDLERKLDAQQQQNPDNPWNIIATGLVQTAKELFLEPQPEAPSNEQPTPPPAAEQAKAQDATDTDATTHQEPATRPARPNLSVIRGQDNRSAPVNTDKITSEQAQQDEVVEGEIIDETDPIGEIDSKERIATAFQILDLATEHKTPAVRALLNLGASVVARENGLNVDDKKLAELRETHTTGNVTPQRLAQGLQLVGKLQNLNDQELKYKLEIADDGEVKHTKSALNTLHAYVALQLREAQEQTSAPTKDAVDPTPSGKEIAKVEPPKIHIRTVKVAGPHGADMVANLFGPPEHTTSVVLHENSNGSKVFQIRTPDLPNAIPIGGSGKDERTARQYDVLFNRQPGAPYGIFRKAYQDDGSTEIIGYISGITGKHVLGQNLEDPNLQKNIEHPNPNTPHVPGQELAVAPPHLPAASPEFAKLQAEVAALRRSITPKEPQEITGHALPTRGEVALYYRTTPDGSRIPMTALERLSTVWEDFKAKTLYTHYRAFMGAPVSPHAPLPPTFSSDLRANFQTALEKSRHARAIRKGTEKGLEQGWAGPAQLDSLRVDPNPAGGNGRRLRFAPGLAAPENVGLIILGKTGSGKDHYVAKNMLVEHIGPANIRSVKLDLVAEILYAREQIGPTYIFAPLGLGDKNSPMERQFSEWMSTFSPIAYMGTYDEASHVGQLMMDTGTTTRSGEARDFWNQFARDLVTFEGFYQNKLLQSNEGGTMADVVNDLKMLNKGLFDAQGDKPQAQQAEGRKRIENLVNQLYAKVLQTGDDDAIRGFDMARGDWESFIGKHHKQSASIVSTAQTLVRAYNNTRVMDATSSSRINFADIIRNNGTVFTYASAMQQRELAPIFRVFDDLMTEEAVRQYANTGRALPRSLVNFRGEAGAGELSEYTGVNISTGRGQGVVEVLQAQNIKQLEDAIGKTATSVALNNMQVLILPGVDDETQEYFQKWAGKTKVTETEKERDVTTTRRTRVGQVINVMTPSNEDKKKDKRKKIVTTKEQTRQVVKDKLETDDLALPLGEAITFVTEKDPKDKNKRKRMPVKVKLQPNDEHELTQKLTERTLRQRALRAAGLGRRRTTDALRELTPGVAETPTPAQQLEEYKEQAVEGQSERPAIESSQDLWHAQQQPDAQEKPEEYDGR